VLGPGLGLQKPCIGLGFQGLCLGLGLGYGFVSGNRPLLEINEALGGGLFVS
jgi:hypothetical protein